MQGMSLKNCSFDRTKIGISHHLKKRPGRQDQFLIFGILWFTNTRIWKWRSLAKWDPHISFSHFLMRDLTLHRMFVLANNIRKYFYSAPSITYSRQCSIHATDLRQHSETNAWLKCHHLWKLRDLRAQYHDEWDVQHRMSGCWIPSGIVKSTELWPLARGTTD